jgi:hypothetical protein
MDSETDYGFRGRQDEHAEQQHSEGHLAKSIEQQTAKLPSDTFMWAALGSMGASLILAVAGKGKAATFVGQWVPTLLIVGVYNKLVKLHGSDGTPSTT